MKEATALEFGFDAKRFCVWCSQKNQLAAMKKEKKFTRKRLDGAGRKPDNVEMEEELFGWIVARMDPGKCNGGVRLIN